MKFSLLILHFFNIVGIQRARHQTHYRIGVTYAKHLLVVLENVLGGLVTESL